MRAISAFAVVVFHASSYLRLSFGDDLFNRWFDYRFGLYAVTCFFVISGYLMSGVVARQDASLFLLHRLIRIYPTFLIVVGFVLFTHYCLGVPFDVDWIGLSLMPFGSATYPLHVEWTLIFELTFYVLLFGILSLELRASLPYLTGGWAAAIAIANMIWRDQAPQSIMPLHLMMLSVTNTGFLGGMLVRPLARHRIPLILAAALCVGCAIIGSRLSYVGHQVMASIGATMLLASLVQRSERPHLAAGRILERQGDHSYALYLVHVPIILLVYAAPLPIATRWLWALAIAGSLLVSIPIGMLDVAMYRRLKRLVDRMPGLRRRVIAALYLSVFVGVAGYGSAVSLRQWVESRPRLRIGLAIQKQLHGGSDMELKRAAEAAGLVPALDIIGSIDLSQWLPGPVLQLGGWAADNKDAHPLDILVFQGSRFVASFRPNALRQDVAAALGHPALATIATGFSFGGLVPCRSGDKAVLLAFDHGGRFNILGSGDHAQACPSS